MNEFIKFEDSILNVGMILSVVKTQYCNYNGIEQFFIEIHYALEESRKESFRYTTEVARDLAFGTLVEKLTFEPSGEGV